MAASACIVSPLSGPIISSSFRFRAKLLHPQLSTRPLGRPVPIRRNVKCAAATGSNGHRSGLNRESFWLSMARDVAGSLRSLAVFLAEQPGQLKYIEWPTFQSTLKTATLTLVLVALLIVALTSIDSSLCYILALLLRKPA